MALYTAFKILLPLVGNINNIKTGWKRILISTFAILLLLLSSCSVKYVIKSFLHLQHTEHAVGTVDNKRAVLNNTLSNCQIQQLSEQTALTTLHDITSADAIILFIFLGTLIALVTLNKKEPSGLYSKDTTSLPVLLFLRNRQLLI